VFELCRKNLPLLTVPPVAIIATIATQAMLTVSSVDVAVQHKTSKPIEHLINLFLPRAPVNQWVEIPDWLAGTWCSFNKFEVHPKSESRKKNTSKSEPKQFQIELKLLAVSSIGTARDSQGHVWQYIGAPSSRQVRVGNLIERQTIEKFDIVIKSPTLVEVQSVVLIEDSDCKTGKRYSAITEKTVITHQFVAPDEMWTHVTLTDSDGVNHFSKTYENATGELRVQKFQQSNIGDLQALFDQFIKNKN
jgi:hypothetical protein